MEMMELVIPAAPPMDFNFDSTCSSPYLFFSAPTSPSRISSFYSELSNSPSISSYSSPVTIPFDWEEKPGTPKSRKATQHDQENGGFEFDFSVERNSLSADELFHGGKIKPLKPPPGYNPASSVSTPRSSSPKSRTKCFDPFQAAIEEMQTQEFTSNSTTTRTETSSDAKSGQSSSYAASFLSAVSFSKSKGYCRKWKLKDFSLFRSSSEGRAARIKDPRTGYEVLSKQQESMDDVKNSSVRSTDSSSIGSSRRSSVVSAHGLHYKQGVLGCLGFNPGDLARRVGSLPRG